MAKEFGILESKKQRYYQSHFDLDPMTLIFKTSLRLLSMHSKVRAQEDTRTDIQTEDRQHTDSMESLPYRTRDQ